MADRETTRKYGLIVGILCAASIVGAKVYGSYRRSEKQDAEIAHDRAVKLATLTADRRRTALQQLEPCVDQVEIDEVSGDNALGRSCTDAIDGVVQDPAFLPAAAIATLQKLRAVGGYGADKPARHAALREARAVVLPLLRDRLSVRLAAYESAHGRDALWWRVHLQTEWWHVVDVALVAAKVAEGGPADLAAASAAARAPYAAIMAEVPQAPPEIQRAVSQLAFATGAIATGAPLEVPALSRFVNNDLVPNGTDMLALGPDY